MSSTTELSIIAFWLLPAREYGDYLRRLIRNLAAQFDAPVFEPHVTLYSAAAARFTAPAEAIARIVDSPQITLRVRGIAHSEKFTKTLFVELLANEAIRSLSRNIAEQAREPNEFNLEPHVSLIYKHLSEAARAELAPSVALPFDEITFDSECAVHVPAENNSTADVNAWREAAPPQLLARAD
jgi:hypothetical protein